MARRKDQSKVAEGLAKGLCKRDALRAAGYSESTIEKKGYQIVRRPLVQSALTDAMDRLGVTMEKIMRPVADALDAKIRVKVPTEGGSIVETDAPDHRTRLEGHDRAVALLGAVPRQVEMPPPLRPAMVVVIRQAPAVGQAPPPKQINAPPTIEAEAKKPNGKGHGQAAPARAPLVVTIKKAEAT